jgi:hypothetical protein
MRLERIVRHALSLARVTAFVAVTVVVGVALGACSDDELTLEEYFQRIEEIDGETEDRYSELSEEYAAGAELQQLRDFYPQVTGLYDDFVADLEAIEPPEQAASLHAEAVAAARAFRDVFGGLSDDLEQAESSVEFLALANAAVERANEQFLDVCLEMEALALANNIGIDLECEG